VPAGSFGSSTTESNVAVPLPTAGTVSGLQVRLSGGSPGSGNSYTFSVVKNGSAVSGFTCTISDSNTTCTDTDTLAMAIGETLSLRAVGNSNPSARAVTWSLVFG
jgi:hypothetical protein